MASFSRQPVIVNQLLQNTEIMRLLQGNGELKVKVSPSTLPGTVIFPVNSLAFLFLPIKSLTLTWPPTSKHFISEKAEDRVRKFAKIHRKAVVFIVTPTMFEKEAMVFSEFQSRFFNTNLWIIPAQCEADCVNTMRTVTHPERRDPTDDSLAGDKRMNESTILKLLERNLQITAHLLLDSCGTLSNIVTAEVEKLKDCSLSSDVARDVQRYFHEDGKE